MIAVEPWQLSAEGLAAAIRGGDLSATEALESVLARADAITGALNPFAVRLDDRAREAAADRCRRGDLCDDDDAGVLPDRRHRVEAARADAQPLEPRADARRVVGRCGRGPGRRCRAAGAGRRRWRVDPHPGRVLWAGRL